MTHNFSFVEYSDINSLQNKKPLAVVYRNHGRIQVSKLTRIWSDVYLVCCAYLYNNYPNVFKENAGKPLSGQKIDIAFGDIQKKQMISPRNVADILFVETNYCSVDLVYKIDVLLRKCGLEANNLLIAVVDENTAYSHLSDIYKEFRNYIYTDIFKTKFSLNAFKMANLKKELQTKIAEKEQKTKNETSTLKEELQRKINEIERKKINGSATEPKKLWQEDNLKMNSKHSKINKSEGQIENNATLINNHINDLIVKEIISNGYEYIDNRHKAGCLWLLGDHSIGNFVKQLEKKYSVEFEYAPDGGKATNLKSSWWTKNTVQISGNVEDTSNLNSDIDMDGLKDCLLLEVHNRNISYVDKRHEGGCLWLLGGLDIKSQVESLEEKYNIKFFYSKNGGNTTSGLSGWWTRTTVHFNDYDDTNFFSSAEQNISHKSISPTKVCQKKHSEQTKKDSHEKITKYVTRYKNEVIKTVEKYLDLQNKSEIIQRGYTNLYPSIVNLCKKNRMGFYDIVTENFEMSDSLIILLQRLGYRESKNEIDSRENIKREKMTKHKVESLIVEFEENNDETKSFSELLSISSKGYEDILIESIPFSVRVFNRLKSSKIKTVADLLNSTPEELLRIKGFGANSIKEVKSYLQELPPAAQITTSNVDEKRNVVKLPKIIFQNRKNIIEGDFSFVNQENIREKESVKKYFLAYNELDPEIVQQCYYAPDDMVNVINMLESFCKQYAKQQELLKLVEQLPKERQNKKACGYIKAYRKNAEKREFLSSFCFSNDDTLLTMCLNCKTATEGEIIELTKFFNWCNFNLADDVDKVVNSLFSNERNRTVIQMRARKQTLEQTGQAIGVTRERVRQIEAKVKQKFYRLQGQLKIISKISAERDDDIVLTLDEIRPFCGEYTEELIYLLKDYNSPNYVYDKTLEVFILSDESPQEQVCAYVDSLPDVIPSDELDDIIKAAEHDELPAELVERAIQDAYKLTGRVYHREALTLVKIYEDVLNKYYSNGIKAYDHEELQIFRKYVRELYGNVYLPENDRAITARITDIGILCDKGMYKPKKKQYISVKLAEDIYNFIMVQSSDMVLMNIVFDSFASQLHKEGVHNKYYLQGILHELYNNKLYFRRDYVSKTAECTSFYGEIVSFIKKYSVPVTKKQIQNQFPGITDVVISLAVNNDEEILNYFGEYFYAGYLNISKNEKLYLNNLMKKILSDKKTHHVKEIYEIVMRDNPSIFKRNAAMYPHSAFSIMEYLFKDQYQFSRPYIAKNGLSIDKTSKQLHDFVYSKDIVKLDDIKEYTQELYYVIYSTINLIDSFNDEYFWLNKESIIRIEQTGITQELVQDLEKYLSENLYETTPIAHAFSFYRLPVLDVEWSDWMLYSVLKKWGTKVEVGVTSAQLRYAIPVVAPLGELDITKYADLKPEDIMMKFDSDLDDLDDLIADLIEDDLWGDDNEF